MVILNPDKGTMTMSHHSITHWANTWQREASYGMGRAGRLLASDHRGLLAPTLPPFSHCF